MSEHDGNGWGEWRKHVLACLEDAKDDREEIKKQLVDVRVQVAMLKVKSSAWGALAGILAAAAAILIKAVAL